MTLQSVKLVSESICLLVVAGCAVYAVRDLHQTQVEARGTISASTATLEYVNRPCASVDPKTHKLLPDGTLCQLNQAIHDLRKIATASGKQVQQTSDVITAMSANLNKAGDGVTKLSDSLSKTADQATTLTAALTDDATAAKSSLEAFPPLLRQSTQAVAHLDAFIQSPDLTETVANVNGTTRNMAAVSADAKKVADDATKRYFKPTPWYRKIVPYATAGAKIASYALPW